MSETTYKVIKDFSNHYSLGWRISYLGYNNFRIHSYALYREHGWWTVRHHFMEDRAFDSLPKALVYLRALINPKEANNDSSN